MAQSIDKLLEVMAALRDPDSGCPWDLEQTFETIIPYTLEETYEVVDAIESGNFDHVREELGDLLFQVVFYSRMAEEEGLFDFDAVASGITEKLLRRHPHIFDPEESARNLTPEQVSARWDEIKQQEKKGQAKDASLLAGIPASLPALQRGEALQKKAARAGFDWPGLEPVVEKLEEELAEFKSEAKRARRDDSHGETGNARLLEELGDIIFTCINIARHLGADPETVARKANRKFESRFRQVEEKALAAAGGLEGMSVDGMEELWQQVKAEEDEAG